MQSNVRSAVLAATCDLCGTRFENAYQLGPHKKICRPTWQEDLSSTDFTCSSEEEEMSVPVATPPSPAPSSTQVVSATPLWQLARRDKTFGIVHRVVVESTGLFNADLSSDYVEVSLLCLHFRFETSTRLACSYLSS